MRRAWDSGIRLTRWHAPRLTAEFRLSNGILDDNGRVLPEVLAAHRRGIVFDFGNGMNGHFNWDMVERAMTQGFRPDTFSADWNAMSRTIGVVNFPNVMSKFFMFGMSLNQIIARATVNAARLFPAFSDRCTLNVGAPADVALLAREHSSSWTTTKARAPADSACSRSRP